MANYTNKFDIDRMGDGMIRLTFRDERGVTADTRPPTIAAEVVMTPDNYAAFIRIGAQFVKNDGPKTTSH